MTSSVLPNCLPFGSFIEPLLTRSDHNQLTSNQQTGNLLPGIALDLSLKVVAAVGLRMNCASEAGGREAIRMSGGRVGHDGLRESVGVAVANGCRWAEVHGACADVTGKEC